jgi:hypothetical protein
MTIEKGTHIVTAYTPHESKDIKSFEGNDGVNIWFQMVRNGTVEWWFSDRQCQVWQDGRKSATPRM